jgi:alkylmercury lyase-like protein
MPQDSDVRLAIYDSILTRGLVPTAGGLSEDLGCAADEIRGSLARLATGRVLVLDEATGEILMAPPFSAVPTGFRVAIGSHEWFANCSWDALGVLAMARTAGIPGSGAGAIRASCGDCGSTIELDARDIAGRTEPLLHFAIPARDWWRHIVFT